MDVKLLLPRKNMAEQWDARWIDHAVKKALNTSILNLSVSPLHRWESSIASWDLAGAAARANGEFLIVAVCADAREEILVMSTTSLATGTQCDSEEVFEFDDKLNVRFLHYKAGGVSVVLLVGREGAMKLHLHECLQSIHETNDIFSSDEEDPLPTLDNTSKSKLLVMGSGTSEGVPILSCLTKTPVTCATCLDASVPGSKNRRRNTGVMLQTTSPTTHRQVNIMVDCGKFFWESAMELFPRNHIRTIDALVLTHEHFDAIGGFDDLRDWTAPREHGSIAPPQNHVDIYLTETTMDHVRRMFPYLVDTSTATGSGKVAALNFHTFTPSDMLTIHGVSIEPLPCPHGRNCTCVGFRFGDTAYISDCHQLPEHIMSKLKECRVLILDALRWGLEHASHLTVEQAIDVSIESGVEEAFFVGMDHTMEQEATNHRLSEIVKERGVATKIQLAYDGLVLPVNL